MVEEYLNTIPENLHGDNFVETIENLETYAHENRWDVLYDAKLDSDKSPIPEKIGAPWGTININRDEKSVELEQNDMGEIPQKWNKPMDTESNIAFDYLK